MKHAYSRYIMERPADRALMLELELDVLAKVAHLPDKDAARILSHVLTAEELLFKGLGVELGDLHGVPRATLISPCDSAKDFIQAAGHAHRRNSVSGVIQYIMVANSEVEQKIKRSLDRKLENIESIQDSDLFGEIK